MRNEMTVRVLKDHVVWKGKAVVHATESTPLREKLVRILNSDYTKKEMSNYHSNYSSSQLAIASSASVRSGSQNGKRTKS